MVNDNAKTGGLYLIKILVYLKISRQTVDLVKRWLTTR